MFETVDSIQKYRLQCYNSSSQNCCQVFFLKNNIFYVIFFNTAMKLTLQSYFPVFIPAVFGKALAEMVSF